jgi:hypothetical protein
MAPAKPGIRTNQLDAVRGVKRTELDGCPITGEEHVWNAPPHEFDCARNKRQRRRDKQQRQYPG